MKKIATALLLILFAATLSWGYGTLIGANPTTTRPGGIPVQGHAPNGKKDVALTVNSQTVDMTGDLSWEVYAASGCKFRTMSTATKAGKQRTIPAGVWTGRLVNPATPYANFSGCTSGELTRQ